MSDDMTEAPERIYLEPGEPESWDPHFGRAWCEDDVWEREADDPGVAYVRADLVEPLFDGEGSYAGSVAGKIERLVGEHGSEIMQEIVSQHFAQVRNALHGEDEG